MEARRQTRFVERGLAIGDRAVVPFYAAAMHYWRVEPARWAACLKTLHAQGLTCVETYVPWRVHEVEPGRFAWSGVADLPRFLTLARAEGLHVVLRPGPHVNAELTCFGIPDFVVADPACQARTARGTPVWLPSPPRAWPVPSYASAAFRAKVTAWFRAVGDVVAPFAGDPVVAIGVDNEAQMFFRLGAYDFDYHPDAITWWNEASGIDGDPPRGWDPAVAARCISWVRFKDQYLARALGDFAHALDAAGLASLAKFHNLPPGHVGLYDLPKLQHAIRGPVGIDAYTPRTDFSALRRRALACTANASPIPIAFEVGIGFFPWFPPLDTTAAADKDRERDHLLTLLAGGIRGFNLFMGVERDRYYGAAIRADGTLEPHATWIAPLLAALTEVDWPSLRRRPQIALVDTRADARFGLATTLLDPITPVLTEVLDLGPGGAAELGTDPAAIAARRWHAQIAAALELAQIPYAIVDESTPEDDLARYRAVVVPTLDRIDRGLWQRITQLAEHKRAIVVIGPNMPTKDELGQPLVASASASPPRRLGKLKAGSLEDLRGLADDLLALVSLPETWQIERPDGVRAHAFSAAKPASVAANTAAAANTGADADADADTADDVRVIFVLSDLDRPTTATLFAEGTLRDPFTRETLRATDGRVQIALAARGVRMFVVDR